MARRNPAEILTGAAVLLIAAGFLVFALAHTGRSVGNGYRMIAKFDHIDGLSVGSDVRIGGVQVGSVTNTALDPKTYQAVVTLGVKAGLQLPKDSSAEVTSDGLLGGKYLALVPGGDTQMIGPGGEITITQGSISLEALLGKFIFSVSDAKKAPAAPASPPPAAAPPGAAPPAAPSP